MADVPRYLSMSSLDDCFSIEPLLEHSAHLCRGLKDALECHPTNHKTNNKRQQENPEKIYSDNTITNKHLATTSIHTHN